MSQFQINNHQNIDYTLVANSFIDSFMADANDVQIKVYLFLLRHMNTPHMCSISAMADFFNYSEKDVIRALTYWERKQILNLSYNNKQELCGIELRSVTEISAKSMNQTESVLSVTPPSQAPMVKTNAYVSNTSVFVKPEYSGYSENKLKELAQNELKSVLKPPLQKTTKTFKNIKFFLSKISILLVKKRTISSFFIRIRKYYY